MKHAIEVVVAFVVLGTSLRLLEHFFPARPRARERTGRRVHRVVVDVLHWFVSGPMGNVVADLGFFAAIVFAIPAIVFMRHGQWDVAHPAAVFSRLPVAVQVVFSLVASDFLGYVSHRLHHRVTVLWRLHAIHHSSRELDWLAAARNHPLGELTARVIIGLPLLFCGVDPRVLASILPFVGLWGVFLHANVRFTFGPLRYVIATPLFHRWHHSSEPAARDKNFAALFPIWDIAFGTFYCPNHQPTTFGVDGDDVPDGFIGQWLYPAKALYRWLQARRTKRPSPPVLHARNALGPIRG